MSQPAKGGPRAEVGCEEAKITGLVKAGRSETWFPSTNGTNEQVKVGPNTRAITVRCGSAAAASVSVAKSRWRRKQAAASHKPTLHNSVSPQRLAS